MTQHDGNWHRAAPIADIAPDEPIAVTLVGRNIALYNVDGTIYATDAACTHAAANLAEGYQDGDVIECPLHQGRFHIPTGQPLCRPAKVALQIYAVRAHGDDVFVEVPS